jgi:hypothetical protein
MFSWLYAIPTWWIVFFIPLLVDDHLILKEEGACKFFLNIYFDPDIVDYSTLKRNRKTEGLTFYIENRVYCLYSEIIISRNVFVCPLSWWF